MEKIIVGVDGSDTARRGLRWALDHSGPNDTLVVVHAWSIPAAAGFELPVPSIAEWELAAHRLVRELVADLGDLSAGPTVEKLVVAGRPGAVICELSQDADHVVVGSRGYSGIRSALLGSVSNHVVHHANCPVTVVPDLDARSAGN